MTSCLSFGSSAILHLTGKPQFTDQNDVVVVSALVDKKLHMFEYNLVANKAREIRTPFSREDSYRDLTYSPNFQKIAFIWIKSGTSVAELCIMNRDGTGLEQLTHSGEYNGQPFFSNDGNLIGFTRTSSKQRSGYTVHVYDLRTRQERAVPIEYMLIGYDFETKKERQTLKKDLYGVNNPSFSADGSKIAFTEYYEHNVTYRNDGSTVNDYRIRLLDVATGELTTVLDRMRTIVAMFLPNTDQMIFLADDKSNGDDYRIGTRKEQHGFFTFKTQDNKLEFIGEVKFDTYVLSVSNDGKKALYVWIDDVGVFDFETGQGKLYKIDKGELIRAISAN